MRTSDPMFSYHQASAHGASPVGQIVALYDTILRDFVRALAALQAGDVETRVFELNHTLLVIAHLQNVLDFERGGDAAKQFEILYSVTRGMIVQANFQATPESIEEAHQPLWRVAAGLVPGRATIIRRTIAGARAGRKPPADQRGRNA